MTARPARSGAGGIAVDSDISRIVGVVVAKLNADEVMHDCEKLGDEIAERINCDLLAQGLVLDSFAIQGVTDRNC